MIVGAIATYALFKMPWVFPLLIVLGGFVTNLSSKRIPQKEEAPYKIKWANIWLFAIVFITAGVLSEEQPEKIIGKTEDQSIYLKIFIDQAVLFLAVVKFSYQ